MPFGRVHRCEPEQSIRRDYASPYWLCGGHQMNSRLRVARSRPQRLAHLNGNPGEDELVFPGHGGPGSRTQANNWRARVWKPVLEGLATEKRLAHLADAIPYDCRGSFVSLHLRVGASPLEVARWAGHSPQVMFQHYANVIEELVDEPRIPVEEQIQRARDVVEDKPAEEPDDLLVDLYACPKVTASGKSRAATLLYEPDDTAKSTS